MEAALVVEAIEEFVETLPPRDREPLVKFARYIKAQEFFREYERAERQRERDREIWAQRSDPGSIMARRLREKLRGQTG